MKTIRLLPEKKKNDVGGFDWKLDEYLESSKSSIYVI